MKSIKKLKHNKSSLMYIRIFRKNIHVFHLILLGFLTFAIAFIVKGTIESIYIAQNGIITNGIITDIRQSGSKGVEDYYYKFIFNGVEYHNSTLHLSKNKGDTVKVIFIQDNPNKNRLKESLVTTYGYFLKRNQNLKER